MSKDKIFKNKNKLQISFTTRQRELLEKEKEETGNTMTSIIRQAVNEYFERRIGMKLQNLSGKGKRRKKT